MFCFCKRTQLSIYALFLQVNHILRLTAVALELASNDEFEELYSKTAWFYDEKYGRRGAAYDIFSHASR